MVECVDHRLIDLGIFTALNALYATARSQREIVIYLINNGTSRVKFPTLSKLF